MFNEHRGKADAETYRRAYTRARNHVRIVLRKKRRTFERDIAAQAKENPKKFFAYCGAR